MKLLLSKINLALPGKTFDNIKPKSEPAVNPVVRAEAGVGAGKKERVMNTRPKPEEETSPDTIDCALICSRRSSRTPVSRYLLGVVSGLIYVALWHPTLAWFAHRSLYPLGLPYRHWAGNGLCTQLSPSADRDRHFGSRLWDLFTRV